jgi:ribosomal-protein-serine acetyltransferase
MVPLLSALGYRHCGTAGNPLDTCRWHSHPTEMDHALAPLPEVVVGPRLVLRRWRVSDVDDLARAVTRNIAHLRPWMPWIALEPVGRDERCDLIDSWEAAWLQGGDGVYGIFADREIIGGCGLHHRRGPTGLEIGYWVDEGHVRQGIATEAAGLLTSAALAAPGITFVEIHHDKANVASSAVPRRLGYEFVGEMADEVTAPGEIGIDCTWRMESQNWRPPSR